MRRLVSIAPHKFPRLQTFRGNPRRAIVRKRWKLKYAIPRVRRRVLVWKALVALDAIALREWIAETIRTTGGTTERFFWNRGRWAVENLQLFVSSQNAEPIAK